MITLEEYQKIDQMDTKLWNIGFIMGFAQDFDSRYCVFHINVFI